MSLILDTFVGTTNSLPGVPTPWSPQPSGRVRKKISLLFCFLLYKEVDSD